MIVIETDHNAYTEDTKSQRKIQMAEEMREAAGEDEQVQYFCSSQGIYYVHSSIMEYTFRS